MSQNFYQSIILSLKGAEDSFLNIYDWEYIY